MSKSDKKLVITIPALNEKKTILGVICSIPKKIEGISDIKIIVVDDGSSDGTGKLAEDAGAIVITHKINKGLAKSVKEAMDMAINLGADIIVNIDADGQYNPNEIPKLIAPILEDNADIVLGSRFMGTIENMSIQKNIGNRLATFFTSIFSGLKISDAQTGFRAFSRETAMRLNILSEYTYTQETIIQAQHKKMKIIELPIEFRVRKEGNSRLIKNIFSYARQAGLTILLTYIYYKPLRSYFYPASLIGLLGILFGSRALIEYINTGHVSPFLPSTILSIFFILLSFQLIIVGLLANILNANRNLEEEILYKLKQR